MRIHHLNCGTMCPVGGKALNGPHPELVCHCLLIETDSGLVLVDTGLGMADIADPGARLGRAFNLIVRPRLDPAETAVRQVERRGFRASDVRHIIVTHLDVDHAGGLSDFPHATVHLHGPELDAALSPPTFAEKLRYRSRQWAHKPAFVRHYANGEPWNGFECVRQPEGLPPEILLVPLAGHSRGHTGVAVQTPMGWLLHAGDAYIHTGQLEDRPWCPPGLRLHERLTPIDREANDRNVARLRDIRKSKAAQVFCSHDRSEWESIRI